MPALIDAHHLGQGQTGNETWARNVVAELAGRPSGAHIAVTGASRAALGSEWTPDRVHEVSSSSTVRLACDLPRLTRRLRPDALLVQYTLPPFSFGRVPGVVMLHDLSFERPEAASWIPAISLARYRATIRRSAMRAQIVLVPSEWTRRDVLETYGLTEDRVLVAGNAVDATFSRYLEQSCAPADHDRSGAAEATVLAVGTVLPRKNLAVVGRAVRALRAQGMAVRLRVVGPIPTAGETIARELRDALGDGLDLVGPVPVAQLAEEYLAADVLAFPSLFEGFGIPLVEAMAAGLPVVSSTSTCLPEVGGDAVRYADPSDAVAWGAALGRVLDDDLERARLAAAGRARAATFSWSHTADVVEEALVSATA